MAHSVWHLSRRVRVRGLSFGAAVLLWSAGVLANPLSLPRFTIEDLVYAGAFRLPAADFGVSSLNYSEGPVAVDGQRRSLFIVGHTHHQAVAEFALPELRRGSQIDALAMASAPLQHFTTLLDRTADGNPQALDRINGLYVLRTGNRRSLLVNALEYYDAPADNTASTLVASNADALSSTDVPGFFALAGGPGHTAGWISAIPDVWRGVLGGTHITGASSGVPIISRTSVGPSAFAFSPGQINASTPAGSRISTVRLLDFSLSRPLASDLYNNSRRNTLWTHVSRASFGFIVPGTRSYLTIGHSGGHASGVCYKCTQTNGTLCGGYCPRDHRDSSAWYWLWDVADLLAVRRGQMPSHAVRPYAHGAFGVPFGASEIGGGSFDNASGTLYLSLQRADTQQGQYNNPPVIAAFRVQTGTSPTPDHPSSSTGNSQDNPGLPGILLLLDDH